MEDSRNTILAILLSVIVLIAWQYFVGIPQLEKQKTATDAQKQTQSQQVQPGTAPTPGPDGMPVAGTAPTPGALPGQRSGAASREDVIAASPRISVDTPRMRGSIALRGARIDDVALKDYRETVDPKSPNIVLLAPSG